MSTPSTSELLKFAELQMAAEAFLVNKDGIVKGGTELQEALETGNNHASKFTKTEATKFLEEWEVVAQVAPDSAEAKTGFSGTLFRKKGTEELVISFRSTEFIDDAARDNQSTNALEIADHGLALGQIAAMESWYAKLVLEGKISDPSQLSVTGYSLGGHLATAFNVLRHEAGTPLGTPLKQVVTFNGAGMGTWDGSLTSVIKEFQNLSNLGVNPSTTSGAASAAKFGITDSDVAAIYARIWDATNIGLDPAFEDKQSLEAISKYAKSPGGMNNSLAIKAGKQADLVLAAIKNIEEISIELKRLESIAPKPATISPANVAQFKLDYQTALVLVTQKTNGSSKIVDGVRAYAGKPSGGPVFDNQFDVVGATSPSAVANSGDHYGQDVQVFIEDQPLYRGSVIWESIKESWEHWGIKLLVNDHVKNDFGDTHSLVLLVDSLLVQNTILQMLPEGNRSSAEKELTSILAAASYIKASQKSGTQGKAEGDVLENVVNALADFVGVKSAPLKGNLEGGTWADQKDREELHKRLKEISDKFQDAKGLNLTLEASGSKLVALARKDYGAYMALSSLSPFALLGVKEDSPYGSTFGEKFKAWKDDAEQTDPNLRLITDTWLTQRADFLERKNWFGKENINPFNPAYEYVPGGIAQLNSPDIFVDEASGYTIQQGSVHDNSKLHYFGNDLNNTRTGSKVEDWLFGGGGNDSLNGGEGNDYIEGNSGDDTLDGGLGNDELNGGEGKDTYKFFGSFGSDTIVDAKGTGDELSIEGFEGGLPQGKKLPQGNGNTYQSDDKKVTYVLISKNGKFDLVISFEGRTDQIRIRNFDRTNRNFGIILDEAPAAEPVVDQVMNGDFIKSAPGGDEYALTSGYDNYVSAGTQEGAADIINGSINADKIVGLGGNDGLYGGDGDDVIEGGEGSDLILGGTGQDTIEGGQGNDFIFGSARYGLTITRGTDAQPPTADGTELARGFNWVVYDPVGQDAQGNNPIAFAGVNTCSRQAKMAWGVARFTDGRYTNWSDQRTNDRLGYRPN